MSTGTLLSICIPTYNGGSRIKETLNCAIKAVGIRDDVEIIVSDNASTDNTMSILTDYKSKYDIIKVYHNEKNLGFNGNLIKILDEYATGTFCWTIGDDDYLDEDAIALIADLLNDDTDYIAVNFRTVEQKFYESYKVPTPRKLKYSQGDYIDCLENNTRNGNLLGTFMSTHVFRLAIIKQMDKSSLNTDAWNTFATIFPNSYLMLSAFKDNKKCKRIENRVLSAVLHEKNYSNKWEGVLGSVFPDYLDYCINLYGSPRYFKKNSRYVFGCQYIVSLKNFLRMNFSEVSYKHLLSPKSIWCVYDYIKSKIQLKLHMNLL